MPTFTKLGVFALTVALSMNTALAQQPVRKTAAKPAVRPRTATAARPAATQVRKPAAAPVAQQTQAAPVYTQAPAPAPVETRQAPPQQQPVTRTTYARPRSSSARNGRNVYMNAGVGLATYYGGGFPIGVSVEVDAKNNFSVGGSVDYYHYNYGYYSGGYNFIYAGARGSYHFPTQNSTFDPYIGATLGFRYAGYKDSYGSSYYDYGGGYNSGLYVGVHIGARFMFSEKIGAFAELGYGVSALKVGLAAKF
ncbi:hypothetical protein [Spirosoma validum]|uniref:Outer membrane beta-barrel protein n=1 Tax=Spirosoma validum TaxID=2771355 RepID=A0A927B6W6_9BACT|nr:hypothetical protein [Spirosoma validum]MBD2756816.1 hypothetical protein [Spirosoma validum]